MCSAGSQHSTGDNTDLSALIKLLYSYDTCLFYLSHKFTLDNQSQTLINQTKSEFQKLSPVILKYSSPDLLTSLQKERIKLMIDYDVPFDIISKQLASNGTLVSETPTLQKLSSLKPLDTSSSEHPPFEFFPSLLHNKEITHREPQENKQESKEESKEENKQESKEENKQESKEESKEENKEEKQEEKQEEADFYRKIADDYKELHTSFLKNIEEIKPLIKDIGDEMKPYLNNIMKQKLGCDLESLKANSIDKLFSQFFIAKDPKSSSS